MEPEDPFTTMQVGAASLHELFVCYIEAGFTEYQALALVVGVVQAAVAGGAQGGN